MVDLGISALKQVTKQVGAWEPLTPVWLINIPGSWSAPPGGHAH